MSKDITKKGFLERIPSFSLILIMAVLMVIGMALVPLLRVAYNPTPKQGKQLNVSFNWPGASPRVIEQEITSKIEGMVSSVVGVEKTSSTSSYGSGNVAIELKENASVSAVRFEISSLLKQVAGKLPEGAGYPSLSGGSLIPSSRSFSILAALSFSLWLPKGRMRAFLERRAAVSTEVATPTPTNSGGHAFKP